MSPLKIKHLVSHLPHREDTQRHRKEQRKYHRQLTHRHRYRLNRSQHDRIYRQLVNILHQKKVTSDPSQEITSELCQVNPHKYFIDPPFTRIFELVHQRNDQLMSYITTLLC